MIHFGHEDRTWNLDLRSGVRLYLLKLPALGPEGRVQGTEQGFGSQTDVSPNPLCGTYSCVTSPTLSSPL